MKSQRSRARQNLLVAAVNTALERGLITLEREPVTPAAFEFEIAGEPVIASVRDVGFDEVSVKVMVRPTAQGWKFIHAAHFLWVAQVREGVRVGFAWSAAPADICKPPGRTTGPGKSPVY